ncbi:MAG: UvrD-helicase domain-containing protein [Verrucomicrobia bacterium]|nr:UvrD-helicase domain-containing protein [Verrucomicrobiota bacterium]
MLNPQQKKAVETTKGRVLVLAGAGSGKTKVITHRIAHLIKNLHVKPSQILGLTFTNKAAEEMRKRVAELIGPEKAAEVTLSTFHSFCMKILRSDIEKLGYTRHFSLYDEQDVRRMVKQLAGQLLGQEKNLPAMEETIAAITRAKNRGEIAEGSAIVKEIFTHLETSMRAYNAVDFDSLLSLTLQLLQDHPDILKKYQQQFQYIMIDEYQDTNPTQFKIADLLARHHGNLCVVGDDDQAIYSWRGAEVQNILRFEADHTIKLEQNYRSTPAILGAANHVIRHNKTRHIKELWAAGQPGEEVTIFHAPTEKDEAEAVVYRAMQFHKAGIPWKEMAILYRSNVLSSPLEIALMQTSWEDRGQWVRGIPYEVFGGTEFYERSEIKDIAAYLRAIINPQDQEALLRIINVPRRGISDSALDRLTSLNRKERVSLWKVLEHVDVESGLSDRALAGVGSFVHLIEEARRKFEHPPYGEALRWLLQKIDYTKAIQEEVKSEKAQQAKSDNVEAFIKALESFPGSLTDFLESLALGEKKWEGSSKTENKINLMTLHSAKGLEFKVVFVVGLEDHILPHEKSVAERGLEEERRLFYVAITRAKKHLFLSMARSRKRYGKDVASTPSRFLFEIPKELLRVTKWDCA